MKLVDVNVKIRCDIPNCKQPAKFKVKKEGFVKNAGLLLCKDCVTELYTVLASNIVPKSPDNVLNKRVRTTKKVAEVISGEK